MSPSIPKRLFRRKSALKLGYPPPPEVGKKSPLEVLPAADETDPKPKAASICCALAVLSKRQNTKKAAINVSFFKVFSMLLSRLDVTPSEGVGFRESFLRSRIFPCSHHN